MKLPWKKPNDYKVDIAVRDGNIQSFVSKPELSVAFVLSPESAEDYANALLAAVTAAREGVKETDKLIKPSNGLALQ